jgi:hypothetical protein
VATLANGLSETWEGDVNTFASISVKPVRVQPVDATPSDRDHLYLEVVFMRLVGCPGDNVSD